jgi:hypothetical protein
VPGDRPALYLGGAFVDVGRRRGSAAPAVDAARPGGLDARCAG